MVALFCRRRYNAFMVKKFAVLMLCVLFAAAWLPCRPVSAVGVSADGGVYVTDDSFNTENIINLYGENAAEAAEAIVAEFEMIDDLFSLTKDSQIAELNENGVLFGADQRVTYLIGRALELFDQNADPKISRVGIYNSLASIALSLDETDRAVELLKQNNVEGLNNAAIGQALARGGAHRDEALDYLETALLRLLAQLTSICMGYLNTGESGGSRDTTESRALVLVVCGFFDGLRQPGSLSPMDKYIPVLRAGCALLSEKQGLAGQAEDDLRAAFVLAQKYDASPVGLEVLRFIRPATLRQARVVDDMGPTARDGVEKFLQENQAEYPRLHQIWEGLCHASKE